jgi:uncharacterized protein YfcZ (UPF0381/DUF406 family)
MGDQLCACFPRLGCGLVVGSIIDDDDCRQLQEDFAHQRADPGALIATGNHHPA